MEQLDRKVYQRIFGRPATKPPGNHLCWNYRDGKISVDLNLAKELSKSGGAIYLFDKTIGEKIIVARDSDGELHVFRGRCRHQEKNDPGSEYLSTCCTVNIGARDRDEDKALAGIPPDCVHRYEFKIDGNTLVVQL